MESKLFRVGIGFDCHRFDHSIQIDSEQNKIKLCGIQVPCPYKIIAHSDGDLVLHALTDALLGAMGKGDIGEHFPPTDQKWENANSETFVLFALNLLKEQAGTINNIDITIITEVPKISPYKDKFARKLSNLLSLEQNRINVKAKTAEKMGAIGREEGIACQIVIGIEISQSQRATTS